MKVKIKTINEKQEFKRPNNIVKDNMNILDNLKILTDEYNRQDEFEFNDASKIEEYLKELGATDDIEVDDIDFDNIGLYTPKGTYVYVYGFSKMPGYGVIIVFESGRKPIGYHLIKYRIETKEVLVPEKLY